jgi:hypothetical protein
MVNFQPQAATDGQCLGNDPFGAPVDPLEQPGIQPLHVDEIVTAVVARPQRHVGVIQPGECLFKTGQGQRRPVAVHDDDPPVAQVKVLAQGVG